MIVIRANGDLRLREFFPQGFGHGFQVAGIQRHGHRFFRGHVQTCTRGVAFADQDFPLREVFAFRRYGMKISLFFHADFETLFPFRRNRLKAAQLIRSIPQRDRQKTILILSQAKGRHSLFLEIVSIRRSRFQFVPQVPAFFRYRVSRLPHTLFPLFPLLLHCRPPFRRFFRRHDMACC